MANWAWDLASAFTSIEDYKYFYKMFDYIFINIKLKPLKDTLLDAIKFSPKTYHDKLTQAIKMNDTKLFIKKLCRYSLSLTRVYSIDLSYAIPF